LQIQIINVAQKLPAWVDMACEDYIKRLPREMTLKQVTLPLAARKSRQSAQKLQQRESELIMEKIAPGSFNLALDEVASNGRVTTGPEICSAGCSSFPGST